MLKPSEIEELHGLVDKYKSAMIVKTAGTKALMPSEVAILKKYGLKVPSLALMTVEQSFKFGILASTLSEANRKGLAYEAIKAKLKNSNFLPLSARQQFTVDYLENQLVDGIRLVSERAKADISRTLVMREGDRIVHHPKVIESVKNVVENKGHLWDAISEIGDLAHPEGKWTRDIGRIANAVHHEAYNNGQAAGIEKNHGPLAKVYFDVFPHACKHCIRLYLTGGIGSEPRIFTIPQLRANGTNIGRRAAEWRAVLGGVHPNCRCSLNDVPEGFIWEEEKRAFTATDPDWRPKHHNSKSKVKITVTRT